ncbi:AMP-binding protein [Catenulispora acidiphila]|uniref:AMP-binding protein n=1 Tax=Catenulispora acidiphila TaxID=304895 RepID=UPI001CC13DA6|nr:AMP-binding protein [Catenulispora acidiphila]
MNWLLMPNTETGLCILGRDGDWRRHSYADIAAAVRRAIWLLRDRDVCAEDRVAIVLADPLHFVTAFMAALAVGAVPVPLAPPTALREADRYVAHVAETLRVARPDLVCTGAGHRAEVLAALAAAGCPAGVVDIADAAHVPADSGDPYRRKPSDSALLQFTSGSSGTPKGVRVSWANLTANIAAIRSWMRWEDDDVFASWLPLHHDMGLVGALITSFAAGTDLWLMTPRQFVRTPARWLECFGVHGATITTSPSFGYAHVAARVRAGELDGMDFSRWRVAILGAERIDPAAVADFQALVGRRGFDTSSLMGAYGLAEGTLLATGVPARAGSRLVKVVDWALTAGSPVAISQEGRLGRDAVQGAGWLASCGRAADGVAVTVVDDAGDEVPDGTFGEIRLSGDSLAAGYLTRDGSVPFSARGSAADAPGADPVLDTGDAGFLLDGELYVVGRIGDALRVHGHGVYAEDVEAELSRLGGEQGPAAYAAVFGTIGTRDLAAVFVEGDPPRTWSAKAEQRIRTAASTDLPVLIFQGSKGSIARTSSGKPRRRHLWLRLLDGGVPDGWRLVHGEWPWPAGEQS